MSFSIEGKDKMSSARAGTFQTDHGVIETPIFMPVGTVASVKGVHQTELKDEINADIILGNTYHLYLRPKTDILEEAGGLHKFMSWERPILTDSGGYQVYSLSNSRKIKEEGVNFKSHIDGSSHFFSPEFSMEIQRKIGADIIMAFDECTPYPCDYNYAKRSMHMTHRWLERCKTFLEKNPEKYGYKQFFFPIVQGSTYTDLTERICRICRQQRRGRKCDWRTICWRACRRDVCNDGGGDFILPEDKPRYLMGVGTPINILENIALGIDMFDCVMPTRNARNGMLFTAYGTMNMRNKKWENDFSPIDPMGHTFVDTLYSKAYLRHLTVSNEYLGKQIASIHNLGFYLWLVREARKHILAGDFTEWKGKMVRQMDNRL